MTREGGEEGTPQRGSREKREDDGDRAEAAGAATRPPRLRRRPDHQGSEDQLEAALEAVDAADPEASVRAADE